VAVLVTYTFSLDRGILIKLRSGLRVGIVSIVGEDPEQRHYLIGHPLVDVGFMTSEEIEKRIDELAHKYVETHDKKIIEELYELARELRKLEKKIFSD
jgi:Mg2+ and Co2+ transporter CorA